MRQRHSSEEKKPAAPRLTQQNEARQAVVFALDGQRYALPLHSVRRIVRAVEVTPLTGAPAIVLGAIDVEGRVVPVLDIRQRFGLPAREVAPADQFLIATMAGRTVVLVIDEALDVIECEASAVTGSGDLTPGPGHLEGVVRLDDGLVLLHDLEKFLSLEEARVLGESMAREA